MNTENNPDKFSGADTDRLIRFYGRVRTRKSNIALITDFMNVTVEEYEDMKDQSHQSVEKVEAKAEQAEDLEES